MAELQQTLDVRHRLALSLSQELQTPLTCVVGFAATLLADWDLLDDDIRQASVRVMCTNALELRTLVERLFDAGSSGDGTQAFVLGGGTSAIGDDPPPRTEETGRARASRGGGRTPSPRP